MSVKESLVFPLPQPYAMQCTVTNDNGDKEIAPVVIVPVKISRIDVFTWQIGWACSRGRCCNCQECTYSYKPRNLR